MNPRRCTPRRYRAASTLALLAVLAQLWMVQLSHHHLAMQVSGWLQWGEICTTQNTGTSTSDSSKDPVGMGSMGCPVCSVAATSFTAGSNPVVQEPPPARAVYGALFASATPRALRHSNVRPPAQAPPAA